MNKNKLLVNPLLYHVINDLTYLENVKIIIATHYEVMTFDIAELSIEADYESYEYYFQFRVRGFTCGMIVNYGDGSAFYTPITRAMAYSHWTPWFCTYIAERAVRKGIKLFKSCLLYTSP